MQFLLEKGKLGYIDKSYDGENPYEIGVTVETHVNGLWSDSPQTMDYYLFELLEQISERYRQWKNNTPEKEQSKYFVYMGYHVTNAPMSWDEAQNIQIAKTLGVPVDSQIYHSYSDLTGYLWTNVRIRDGEGHDVYDEISRQCHTEFDEKKYLCLRFEITKKS